MKDTYYFSHDYNPRGDEKIQKLLFKMGWEGYGLYWALIELLYQNDGYMQTEYERIAFELRTDQKKIEFLIMGFDLFKINENAFTSDSILHRLKKRKGKSVQTSKAAKARWDKAKQNNTDALRTQKERKAIKESKVKERKYIKKEFLLIFNRWLEYKKDKKQTFKNEDSIKMAYNRLYKLAKGNPQIATQIIEQSLANNWAGLFDLKDGDFKDTIKKHVDISDDFSKEYPSAKEK